MPRVLSFRSNTAPCGGHGRPQLQLTAHGAAVSARGGPRGQLPEGRGCPMLPSSTPANPSAGSALWLCQGSKDLCSVSAQHARSRPSTLQLPPDAEMRAYAACQDALWALDSLGQVFIRTLSRSCPTGMHWTRLDLSQLGTPCASCDAPANSGSSCHAGSPVGQLTASSFARASIWCLGIEPHALTPTRNRRSWERARREREGVVCLLPSSPAASPAASPSPPAP